MADAKVNGYSLSDARLIRQCRDWQVVDGLPSLNAFMFEQGKRTLSFSWLEKICVDAEIPITYDEAIIELEKSPPLVPEDGFMWAILSSEEIRCSVKEATDELPQMKLAPTVKDPSHVIVWDWKQRCKKTRKKVAMNMAERLTTFNTRVWPLTP